jgi:hypothetical protein
MIWITKLIHLRLESTMQKQCPNHAITKKTCAIVTVLSHTQLQQVHITPLGGMVTAEQVKEQLQQQLQAIDVVGLLLLHHLLQNNLLGPCHTGVLCHLPHPTLAVLHALPGRPRQSLTHQEGEQQGIWCKGGWND